MYSSLNFFLSSILVLAIIILKADTRRHSIRDNERPEVRDYRPSKWIANSAMDVWYGNKSSIDIISREFADIMYKLTGRPVRSILRHRSENAKNISEIHEVKRVARVEINFINSDNSTFHTIRLEPMNQSVNNTVFKGLEPLLGMK